MSVTPPLSTPLSILFSSFFSPSPSFSLLCSLSFSSFLLLLSLFPILPHAFSFPLLHFSYLISPLPFSSQTSLHPSPCTSPCLPLGAYKRQYGSLLWNDIRSGAAVAEVLRLPSTTATHERSMAIRASPGRPVLAGY